MANHTNINTDDARKSSILVDKETNSTLKLVRSIGKLVPEQYRFQFIGITSFTVVAYKSFNSLPQTNNYGLLVCAGTGSLCLVGIGFSLFLGHKQRIKEIETELEKKRIDLEFAKAKIIPLKNVDDSDRNPDDDEPGTGLPINKDNPKYRELPANPDLGNGNGRNAKAVKQTIIMDFLNGLDGPDLRNYLDDLAEENILIITVRSKEFSPVNIFIQRNTNHFEIFYLESLFDIRYRKIEQDYIMELFRVAMSSQRLFLNQSRFYENKETIILFNPNLPWLNKIKHVLTSFEKIECSFYSSKDELIQTIKKKKENKMPTDFFSKEFDLIFRQEKKFLNSSEIIALLNQLSIKDSLTEHYVETHNYLDDEFCTKSDTFSSSTYLNSMSKSYKIVDEGLNILVNSFTDPAKLN